MREARAAGVSADRLRARDLVHPFRGVRATAFDDDSVVERSQALRTRLPADAFFSHVTAALLHGMPLPLSIERDSTMHVSVFDPARPPRISTVVSHQVSRRANTVVRSGGLRLASPATTWCQLAELLSLPDLVAAGDCLITGPEPLSSRSQLERAVLARRGGRGVRKLDEALLLIRVGPRSRPESHGRLLYAAAGLPEPELNGVIVDAPGGFVAMSDYVWRAERVANEYEGGYHAEKGQFRRDILRRERIEDTGYRVSRFTADDLYLRPAETVTRMAARLGRRVGPVRLRAAVELTTRFGR